MGGHCLPVDPYYLSYISKKNHFNTKITLAGRSINSSMNRIVERQIFQKISINKFSKKKILLCGMSYKENVADVRNSLALNIFNNLKKKKKYISAYDTLI